MSTVVNVVAGIELDSMSTLVELCQRNKTKLDDEINLALRKGLSLKPAVSLDEEVQAAVQRAAKLPAGVKFTLNATDSNHIALFSPAEWQDLTTRAAVRPTSLGRAFRHAVVEQRIAEPEDKTLSNKQIYKRLP